MPPTNDRRPFFFSLIPIPRWMDVGLFSIPDSAQSLPPLNMHHTSSILLHLDLNLEPIQLYGDRHRMAPSFPYNVRRIGLCSGLRQVG